MDKHTIQVLHSLMDIVESILKTNTAQKTNIDKLIQICYTLNTEIKSIIKRVERLENKDIPTNALGRMW